MRLAQSVPTTSFFIHLEVIMQFPRSEAEIAKLTAGISLADLNLLVHSSIESGRRLDVERFRELKKRLIERQASIHMSQAEEVGRKWQ